jgi:hypothetical protein
MTRILGIVLIVVGLVGIIFGGIQYDRKRTAVDLGPVDFQVTERKTIPVPPIAGAVALVAGVAMMFVGGKRTAA